MRAAMTEAVKRRLGPYTLLEPIGRGGTAEVHIAIRDGSTEMCVLKQLRGERVRDDLAIRLRREAHVLSQLDHPNIARLIDAGMEGDTFYLALEYIRGRTVRAIIRRLVERRRTIPVEIAVSIALSALSGLEYAHSRVDAEGRSLDLVHRDLSPNNLMLAYDGRVKIIDFGIASGKIDDYRTVPGVILGTMRYISPEQALSKSVDRRSDVYTLGVVLYEMLTGVPVVLRGEDSEILDAVLRKQPEPFASIAPGLPAALWPPVAKAIEKRSTDRFASAAEFAEALAAAGSSLRLATEPEMALFLAAEVPDDPLGTTRVLADDEDTFSADRSSSNTPSAGSVTVSDPVEEERSGTLDAGLERSVDAPTIVEPRRPADSSIPALPASGRRTNLAILLLVIATVMITVAAVVGLPSEPPPRPPAGAARLAELEDRALRSYGRHAPGDSRREAWSRIIEDASLLDGTAPRELDALEARIVALEREPAPIVATKEPTLRTKLEALRLTPDNGSLMAEIHADFSRAIAGLPDGVRAALAREVDTALSTRNPKGFERCVEELERVQRESKPASSTN
jgi:serine/threonine-protein kinase